MRSQHKKEWSWAINRGGMASEVLAFVEQYSRIFDSFLDYEEGGKHSGKQMDKDNDMIFNPRVVQMANGFVRCMQLRILLKTT
jgi:hypothetical protein